MRLNPRATTLLSLLLFSLTRASAAQADTYTWTGAGANNNWSTPANWLGNAVPNVADGSPDRLVFPADAMQKTMNNDLPMYTQIALLDFRGGYVLNGNGLVLNEGITVQIALFGLVDINTPLTLDSDDAAVPVTIQTNTTLRISGAIAGQSELRKSGAGTLHLDGLFANTLNDVVRVVAGTLLMDKELAVPSGLVVDAGTARYAAADAIAGVVRVHAPGTLDVAGFNDTIAALNGDGAVQLGSAILKITHLSQLSSFSGLISGPGNLIKEGLSSFFLQNEHTFTGGVTINGGGFGLGTGAALASNVTMNGGACMVTAASAN